MKKVLDRPEKVTSTLEELQVLSRLKDSVEWAIVKRTASRYILNLQKASFKLIESDPHYLSVRHAEFAGQALGIRNLIKLVEKAEERASKK
jgi:hypothetical protein